MPLIFNRDQFDAVNEESISKFIAAHLHDSKDGTTEIQIKGFKKPEEFHLLVKALEKQPFAHLKIVDLRFNEIDIAFLPSVLQLIKKLPKGCQLNLANNLLSDEDAKKILVLAKEQQVVVLPLAEQLFDAAAADKIQAPKKALIQDDAKLALAHNRHRFVPIRLPRPAAIMKDFMPSIQQETGYSCGPAAIRCVVKYFQTVKACKELKLPSEAKLCAQAGTNAETGSEVVDMVQWFEKQNQYIVIAGQGGTIDLLRCYTNQGIPVIVNDNQFGGHFRVAVAVESHASGNPDYDRIWLADPGARFVGGRVRLILKQCDYANEWHDSQGVKGRYIVAIPKSLNDTYTHLKTIVAHIASLCDFPDSAITTICAYSLTS